MDEVVRLSKNCPWKKFLIDVAGARAVRVMLLSRKQKFFRPQLFDHIPQLRRLFELELLRRFAHIAFEVADVGVDVFLRLEL